MRSELIIATYNSPRYLALVLASLPCQRVRPDSVCVADDGSGPETAAVIAGFAAHFPELAPRHLWHPDQGFRKNVILNEAIRSSDAEHLIFTDGDCLLSPGFVARHRALGGDGRWASGSLIRLPAAASARVSAEDVRSGRVFAHDWLRGAGAFDRITSWLKAMPLPFVVQAALDRLYPIRRTFMGSNASAMRADLLRVNGFDERIAYGGGDKELGVRLSNAGVRALRLRFTAPVVHLDHARGYADPARIAQQRRMILRSRRQRLTWTEAGLVKGARPHE